jgi:sodium-dependent dicarboxylate transporter 2/3/5
MKYLTDDNAISFGKWMAFSVPFVIVLMACAWFLLMLRHKPRGKEINLSIEGKWLKTPKAIIVYITFGLTILLWLTGDFTGMSSYVVAMIPVGVFCGLGILGSEDLKKISWDVLWLVSGGIALGMALQQSGLSKNLVNSLPFDNMPALAVVATSVLIALFMATFMSNTATANLVLPVIAVLGANLSTLESMGGDKMLILATTYACSLALALPVSTPPNAMAYATGLIKSSQMAKIGIVLDVIGVILIAVLMFILLKVGFL